ncbi:hypothetical protein HAX54_035856 [Datura stramonium]|uniref:Uncharacterized protein n=1 Tax=Datura stramonium TaxID=4076 RepID=A0ABS8VH42_DATST|nr:hypothetical protein [Datura stramonium]
MLSLPGTLTHTHTTHSFSSSIAVFSKLHGYKNPNFSTFTLCHLSIFRLLADDGQDFFTSSMRFMIVLMPWVCRRTFSGAFLHTVG